MAQFAELVDKTIKTIERLDADWVDVTFSDGSVYRMEAASFVLKLYKFRGPNKQND